MADLLLFSVPTIGFIILLFPMKITTYSDSWGLILLIMISFGLALITMTYMISFLFKSSNSAFRAIGGLYVLIGFVLPFSIMGVLFLVSNDTVVIIATVIMYVNPFYPFYLSLLFINMSNTSYNTPEDYADFFPGFIPYTYVTVPTMLGCSLIFLSVAIYIDYK
jgi:hypothetical protein